MKVTKKRVLLVCELVLAIYLIAAGLVRVTFEILAETAMLTVIILMLSGDVDDFADKVTNWFIERKFRKKWKRQ